MKDLFIALIASLLLLSYPGVQEETVKAQTASQPERAKTSDLVEAGRMNAMVLRLFKEGKYDEALPLAVKVLALREKVLASDHELIFNSLLNLAEIYTKQKKYVEAAALFERLLNIAEKNSGPESLRTARILDRLGSVQLWGNDMAAAGISLTRALAIKEKLFGPEHLEVAPSLFSLAEYYARRADYSRAKPLYRRALAIWDRKLDRKDPGLMSAVDRYVCLLGGEEEAGELREFLQGRRVYRVGDLALADGVAFGQVKLKTMPSYRLSNNRFISYGRIVIKALVDETGKVTKAETICGDAQLKQLTFDMALKESFAPTFTQGKPQRVFSILIYRYGDHLTPMPLLP